MFCYILILYFLTLHLTLTLNKLSIIHQIINKVIISTYINVNYDLTYYILSKSFQILYNNVIAFFNFEKLRNNIST